MSRDEALNQPIVAAGRRAAPRAVSLNYRYSDSDAARDGNLIRGGLMVPLVGSASDVVGTLAVFWRGREREAPGDEIVELEELAASAGPTIENAKRFLEARQLAELDALTGLHNRRYFDEVLDREVSRAQRYGRSLALILIDLDDLKAINDRVGHLGGDAVLAELGERVREAAALHGHRLPHRRRRVRGHPARVGARGRAPAVRPPAGRDRRAPARGRRVDHRLGGHRRPRARGRPKALFQRADEALYRAKRDGKGRAR